MDKLTLHQAILKSYFEQVEVMFAAGGRNFVFLGIPRTYAFFKCNCVVVDCEADNGIIAIDKTPLLISDGAVAQATEASQVGGYNSLLNSHISNFTATHENVTVYPYDTQAVFNSVIENATAFGFPDSTCFDSDGVSCVWW